MSKPTGIQNSTLSWVRKELDETLRQAAEALEAHTEDPSDSTQLRFCGTHLHQVHGILQMLELFGAAMLVEEMEQVVDGLIDEAISNREDAYEVLMRAILQLSDYLERLQAGLQDIPILVLPLLNDLRAARGANLLTENALFSPNLDSVSDAPRHDRLGGKSLADIARAVRHRYQLGLLGYLREINPGKSLGQMLESLDKLDSAAGDDQAGTVWWVGAGLIEALGLKAVEGSTAVKMLLGQVDRQIKRAIDQGEVVFSVDPPRELIKNLLYYVARSEPVGERVPAIQAQYGLKDLLLDESQLQQAREGMSGPNADILQTVSDAIKEDLAGVKDTLDLFVRGGRKDLDKLAGLGEVLRRIGDTLGVLGLGVPRGVIKEQVVIVDALAQGREEPDEAKLMEIASSLLYVESALDGLIRRPASDQREWLFADEATRPEDRERSERELAELEFKQVYDAAINEVMADVGRIKESIVKFIETGNDDDIAGMDERFAGVCGALRLLGIEDAARLLQAAGRYVGEHILPGHAAPTGDELDALADAITSIEYYLEALIEGRAEPQPILEVAASGLGRLGYLPGDEGVEDTAPRLELAEELVIPALEEEPAEEQPLVEPPAAELDAPADGAFAAPEAEPADAELGDGEPVDAEVLAEPEPAPAPKKTGRVNLEVAVLGNELDPDILEIFVEEAGEVLDTLNEQFPRWRDNADDGEALATTRRMFHTLKGSGRLAGALLLGEVAWAHENMLNRVLDQTIPANELVFDSIQRCIDFLPALIEQINGGEAPEAEVRELMRRADLIADPSRHGELNDAAPSAIIEEPAEQLEEPPEHAQLEADVADLEADARVEETVDETVELLVPPEEDAEGAADAAADEAGDAAEDEIVLESPPEFDLPELQVEELDAEAAPDFEFPETEQNPEAPTAEDDAAVQPVDAPAVEASEPIVDSLELDGEDFALDLPDEAALDDGAGFESVAEEIELGAPDSDDGEVSFDGPGMDPVLYDIFSRETADHLEVVKQFIAEGRPHAGPVTATEGLVRALHTLSGSARMADVDPIARVGRRLETYVEEHLVEERKLLPGDLDLLERGVSLIEELVAALAEPEPSFPNVEPLIDDVNAALAAKQRELAESGADELPGERPQAVASVAARPMDVDPDLVELFLEEAEDILQFLETTVQRWEDEPDHAATIAELHRSLHTLKGGARLAGFTGIGALCHALESVSGDVADHKVPADDTFFNVLHDCLDRLSDMVAHAKAGGSADVPEDLLQRINDLRGGKAPIRVPESVQEIAGADAELMEVFLEEASEILEATESALHAWQGEPGNFDLITELQRALHTLKGGARMAGFQPIANLAHALETLLISVINGRVPASGELFELLERVHDRLFSLREKAAENQPLSEASDLLAAIEALRDGRGPQPTPPAPGKPASQAAPSAEAPQTPAPAAAGEAPRDEARDEARVQHDQVRVRADLLDNLVNYAGEVSIYRARLDQQVGAMRFNLGEFDQTVLRLREQLRTLEIETEAQILYRFEREYEAEGYQEEFDPLELDRFSRMQEVSRALSESVNDLVSIQNLLDNLSREAETLLLQQSRVNTELQDGLMRTRMVPFANLVPRMRRIVRQTCQELNKQAQFKVLGAQGEMDRTVLERVVPPLEHMLRNAVAHGVEGPEVRTKAGKAAEGTITVALSREGADVVIRVADDGGGIKLEAIRKKAIATGLMPENAPLTDREVMQFILEAGFSTAEEVTQIAGRGVGMDVVASEIKQLGGTLEIDSVAGEGTTFTIRLPFTLAINQALLCQAGEDAYAIPLSSIEGVVRMTHEELEHAFANPHQAYFEYAGSRYEVRSLAQLLGTGDAVLPGAGKRSPIILVQTGDHRLAIQVDSLMGNREIVVKSVGPQISSVPGIYGATILADGRVVLILDVSSLARLGLTSSLMQELDSGAAAPAAAAEEAAGKITVMVVDDSITMRKVATRLLERNGYEVVTAKDGVDAVARLQEVLPDGMLLDIEMPRMDGYELATHMRNDPRLKDVPIIMITSRTGEKHRQRAFEIGVNRYLGKPYQEAELLENLQQVLEERSGRH